MGANCPHCSEAISSLPGFVTQETLEQRLEAKNGEIGALKTALSTAKSKADGFDAVVAERDGLRAEITKRDERASRTEAMQAAELDPALLDHVELLYQSATAGLADAPTLADWLATDAKEHPLLADKFGKPAAPTAAAPEASTPQARPNLNGPNLNPNVNANAGDPPPPGGRMSPSDVAAYFNSAEYRALSNQDKRAKIAELQGQVAGQSAPIA